jgi:putative membrane protein insertion efficiency factor
MRVLTARLGAAITFVMIGAITCYRYAISPVLGDCCRFYPSCSAYAIDALKKHGVLRGTLKTAWRLLRCNPWNKGGYDPA